MFHSFSDIFWNWAIPSFIAHLGLSNKDKLFSKKDYDKGITKRELFLCYFPIVNYFSSLFVLMMITLKALMWLIAPLINNKRD
ncbi:hypothetical protein COF68_05815 [Bacillus toyonensis]|uniref:hypothetical protein n=1 Tax=Bacillus toyonensis TaxID=155322 RepID=UPI000BFE7768|nr:hypothetical protein [Bacillus toyonensis]PHE64357.1 hypothetical protein COF68_05815 [Bacillus toyonensis]